MVPRPLNSRHSSVESCTLKLHAWNPFHHKTLTLDSPKPYPSQSKKPPLSDRSTIPGPSSDTLPDLSKLTLVENSPPSRKKQWWELLRSITGKCGRHGSRSLSGRSSDWSRTCRRRRRSSTGAEFPVAAWSTCSSGELSVSGEGVWGSDVNETRNSRRWAKKDRGGGGLETESSECGSCKGGVGHLDSQGSEPGDVSDRGYSGDGESWYGEDFDEEEDDGSLLFWGERVGDADPMEITGPSNFPGQNSHHRRKCKQRMWRRILSL